MKHHACLIGAAILWLGCVRAMGQGSFVHVDAVDHVIISRGSPTVYYDIDMDQNGTVDFAFEAGSSFRIFSTVGNRSVAIPKGGNDLGSFSIPLGTGFEIGPSLAPNLYWIESQEYSPTDWIGQTLHFADTSGTHGYWQPNMKAYLGVEFQIDGSEHYGWIGVETWWLTGVNGGTITDWAYNTVPGEMIFAGQVPEPSIWALLIAGGAFLWWKIRRGPSWTD